MSSSTSIIIHDFRCHQDLTNEHFDFLKLKCIQWNIERGYKLDSIINLLKQYDADIICLQELDIGCDRSDNRNCAYEIAKALSMKCAFNAEFEELASPLRSPESQGGGLHGNAILSKYDFQPYIVAHQHHPYNWERDGHLLLEPRIGERAILACSINIPGMKLPILCYCLHLEVFCGIFGRIKQFSDVLADSRKRFIQDGLQYQIIAGDLNTMAHGIARLSPKYCCDMLRFFSIGYSESAWWKYHIFDVLDISCDSPSCPNPRLERYCPLHLTEGELVQLKNNYFIEPFDDENDMTLHNYKGLYAGKLDWLLLRGFKVLHTGLDNHEYVSSDHKLLYSIVEPITIDDSQDPNTDVGKIAYEVFSHKEAIRLKSVRVTRVNRVALALAAMCVACIFYTSPSIV